VFSYDYENDLLEIYWYDPTTSLWKILTKNSYNNFCNGLTLIKDNFVFSMCDDSVVLMLDLSLQSSCLVSLIDMSAQRCSYGFGVLDDRLYYVVSFTCNQLILYFKHIL